jgi:hypothetical protein
MKPYLGDDPEDGRILLGVLGMGVSAPSLGGNLPLGGATMARRRQASAAGSVVRPSGGITGPGFGGRPIFRQQPR